jgi:hypothetical protein
MIKKDISMKEGCVGVAIARKHSDNFNKETSQKHWHCLVQPVEVIPQVFTEELKTQYIVE